MHALFVFLDGVGLGPPSSSNPLKGSFPGLERLAGGQAWLAGAPELDEPRHVWRSIDANLGLDGLPQSGTGQASLFTGVNCSRLAGRHYGPYPHSATRSTIAARNVFVQVKSRFPEDSEPGAFANAYPDRFFRLAARRDWWTVTTRCCLDAGVPVRNARHLMQGQALSADITGAGWPQIDPPIDPISEEEAAERLLDISRSHRFTLFEYYLSDKAGHSRDASRASAVLASLDQFLGAISILLDPERDLLIVTSDHGNLEDLATRSHTRNPVPLCVRGTGADRFRGIEDLTGVVPALMEALAR